MLLAGVIQVALGLAGFGRLMRFIPRSVMVGFVNALAILIFMAQMPYMVGRAVAWSTRWSPSASRSWSRCPGSPGRARPRSSPSSPSPRSPSWPPSRCPTVGDEGELPDSLPVVVPPRRAVDRSRRCRSSRPYALAMALVGLLESLLTAKLVDDITDTHSDKTREAWGQGAPTSSPASSAAWAAAP